MKHISALKKMQRNNCRKCISFYIIFMLVLQLLFPPIINFLLLLLPLTCNFLLLLLPPTCNFLLLLLPPTCNFLLLI